ncbi:hypothetical protein RRG08_064517 [Elysia crispata]|uniref:Uncharacterized protein n=1 Tax=Elysia crispata TaxID=231223 RepID=A0AAE1CUM4_9GAST|nr:hypothetical protein RRG08_064517 [Elysia crispata]
MLAPLRLDHDGISGFASNQLSTAPVLEVSSFQNLNNEPGLTEKNRGPIPKGKKLFKDVDDDHHDCFTIKVNNSLILTTHLYLGLKYLVILPLGSREMSSREI